MGFRESTIKYIKDLTRAKTIHEVIAKELREAHLKKLEAESAVEYAMSYALDSAHSRRGLRMTQDEIIEMARKAGLDWHTGWTLDDEEPNRFETLVNLATDKEREACVKIVQTHLAANDHLRTKDSLASVLDYIKFIR